MLDTTGLGCSHVGGFPHGYRTAFFPADPCIICQIQVLDAVVVRNEEESWGDALDIRKNKRKRERNTLPLTPLFYLLF